MKEDDFVEKAEIILRYFFSTMRRGHSYTMLNGAKNNDCLVLVPHLSIAKALEVSDKAVSMENLEKLYGTRKPLVLDNTATIYLLQGLLSVIRELEKEMKKPG